MQALQATAQRYSAEEIALRAVPALAPLSVDPIAQVMQIHGTMQANGQPSLLCRNQHKMIGHVCRSVRTLYQLCNHICKSLERMRLPWIKQLQQQQRMEMRLQLLASRWGVTD